MMSVELVLAPGVANSASSLSYPYTNELVNSIIKATVYLSVGDEDFDSFSTLGAYGVFDIDLDFRKCLLLDTHFLSKTGSVPSQGRVWGCRRRFRYYVGTSIFWIRLADFDVNEFKSVSDSPCKFPK